MTNPDPTKPGKANPAQKQRLDQALVTRGLVKSRARARDLVLRGEVKIDGAIETKPARTVRPTHCVVLAPGAGQYISRGALKLRAALDHFGLDPAGRVGLDIGASTGGFTEVLLARGATKVFAVDNGIGQLDPTLAADPRIISLENTDARLLTACDITTPVGALVADVSFISLTKVLGPPLQWAAPGCWLAALIKPQFEAERASIPRHGIVTDPAVHAVAVARVETWLCGLGSWRVLGTIPSPITGGDGNQEFLIGAIHD